MRRRKLEPEAYKNLQLVECFRKFKHLNRKQTCNNHHTLLPHNLNEQIEVKPRQVLESRDKAAFNKLQSIIERSQCQDRLQVKLRMISPFRALSFNHSRRLRTPTRKSKSFSRIECSNLCPTSATIQICETWLFLFRMRSFLQILTCASQTLLGLLRPNVS